MNGDDELPRTLVEDEAALAGYARQLADAVGEVCDPWLRSLVERHAPGATREPEIAMELSQEAAQVVARMRAVLETDIADQTVGPLQVLRRAVTIPTEVLARSGVAPVDRDDFAQRNFPDDLYDLTPASFAEVDSTLHEPGLVWGAAKAHVHLRRRREALRVTKADDDLG